VVANRGIPEVHISSGEIGLTLLRSTANIGDWGDFPVESALELGFSHSSFPIPRSRPCDL
jgi:alpha-mannosidase